jgi:hypothetical protein
LRILTNDAQARTWPMAWAKVGVGGKIRTRGDTYTVVRGKTTDVASTRKHTSRDAAF